MTNPKHPKRSRRKLAAKAPSAKAPTKPSKPSKATPAPPLRTRFSQAQLLRRFHQLLPPCLLASWLGLIDKTFYQRAFTPLITLWYLVFQRLCENHHLSHVMEDAREGGADRLSPTGKVLSQQLCSEATASFSDARQRLPLEVCRKALWHTASETAASFQIPQTFGLRLGLLDGSTCRSRPHGDIAQHFPPHRPGNCKKPPYWCLARVVGVVCAATAVVVDSAMGALKDSEQALSALVLSQRCWAGWLLAGDRNFGVYWVASTAVAAQAQVLLRLTEARARKLARSAGLKLAPGLDGLLSWSPSRQDHYSAGLGLTPIEGRLIAIRLIRPGFRPRALYLFTTLRDPLQCPASGLAQLYAQRWKIELCFRYIKAQMDLGFLECHSAQMLRKEWLAGLIAYNLIRWTMAAAAASAQAPVEALSFSRTRELLVGWLIRTGGRASQCSWERLLLRIAKAVLPKRRKQRPSEPRAVRDFHKDVAKLEGPRAIARKKLAQARAKS